MSPFLVAAPADKSSAGGLEEEDPRGPSSALSSIQFQLMVVFTGKTLGARVQEIMKPKVLIFLVQIMITMKLKHRLEALETMKNDVQSALEETLEKTLEKTLGIGDEDEEGDLGDPGEEARWLEAQLAAAEADGLVSPAASPANGLCVVAAPPFLGLATNSGCARPWAQQAPLVYRSSAICVCRPLLQA